MRTGKLAENVWKRSVLRQIKGKRKEIRSGAGRGEDCAILSFPEGNDTVVTMDTAVWSGGCRPGFTIHSAVNSLAASGSEPVAVMLSVLLPVDLEESELKKMMAEAVDVCSSLSIQIAGVDAAVTDAVVRPVITVTGIGRSLVLEPASAKRMRPGLDLVASKWIGLEGTARIAQSRGKELKQRYPSRMIEEAAAFEQYLSVIPEAAVAIKSGVCAMHPVSEGGIFGALWEMCGAADVGLEAELKQIPVRQETIELCEYYGLNPYILASGGCLLMAAENGNHLVKDLSECGVPATVIGRTTEGRDRILLQEGERRFLELPARDEMHRMAELIRHSEEREEPVWMDSGKDSQR